MTTLKTMVKKPRTDGFYFVYIRIVHNRKLEYIRTNKIVDAEHITSNGELTGPVVNEYCAMLIRQYADRLNRTDVSLWDIEKILEYLLKADEEVCFSEYVRSSIGKMESQGRQRTAKNYQLSVNHLGCYLGTNRIMFNHLTPSVLRKWIEHLPQTSRAKEMYPTCIRQIFKKAIIELNDEERGVIRIKFSPWSKIQILKSDTTLKRAISAEACREFFNRPLPQTKMISSLPELGRDVALFSLCVGGVNTVDLYSLKKKDHNNGAIGYERAETRHSRRGEAYMEMRIEPFVQSTSDKYLSDKEDECLFDFHKRYCDLDNFNANVNHSTREICRGTGMEKEDCYCFYTFRHTWAIIAQNDCDANLFEVAFGMNHSHGLNMTRGYVKLDFIPTWNLNAKVIDFIFFSDTQNKQGKALDFEASADKLFRITKKKMIYRRAYFKGKVVGEFTDIGFSNVEEVISRLVKQLLKDIPIGCTARFHITNCDSEREVVYKRSKGRGF